jgi:hypothetical protein
MVLRGIAAVALIGLLAACAGEQSAPKHEKTAVELAYERFLTYLDNCSATYETDPRTAAVGENELVVREREWRTCAYDGIRTIVMPASTYPGDYAEMIAEDQAMTEKIAQGGMTRSERRARLDMMREEIAAKEASASEVSASHAERNAALVRQIRGLP